MRRALDPKLVHGDFYGIGDEMIIEQMSVSAPPGKRKQLGSALSSLIGPTQVQPGMSELSIIPELARPR